MCLEELTLEQGIAECLEDVKDPRCCSDTWGMTCTHQDAWMVQKDVVWAGIFTQPLLLYPDHRCPGIAPLAEWENPLSDWS